VSTSIKEALFHGRKLFASADIPSFEAELLLQSILKKDRIDLYIKSEEHLSKKEFSSFQSSVQRRLHHEPLSYITGQRFFYQHQLKVSPTTFIPRPETELLVDECLRHLNATSPKNPQLLELCTGSGAIALSLSSSYPGLSLDATDLSRSALQVAQENLNKLNSQDRINLYHGDLFAALTEKKLYDVIVSNPPYIPSQRILELSQEVQAEPVLALDGGLDGLDIINRIIKESPLWLKTRGMLVFEIDGPAQVEHIHSKLAESKFESVFCRNDLSGLPRIMGGYQK
jgi:release factor glutamine methyltransferase